MKKMNYELFNQKSCQKNQNKIVNNTFWSLKIKSTTLFVTALTYFNKIDENLGKKSVAAAQESQRNRYITTWFSSFTPAWFFSTRLNIDYHLWFSKLQSTKLKLVL